ATATARAAPARRPGARRGRSAACPRTGTRAGAAPRRSRSDAALRRARRADLQHVPLSETRRPSHYLSALRGAKHRLRERIDRDILREEALEHLTEEEQARPFERGLVAAEGHLEPPAEGDRTGRGNPRRHRARGDRLDALDLPHRRLIVLIRIEPEQRPQRLGTLEPAAVEQRQVVQ